MPVLEIHRRSGPVETRRLSRQTPLLVGHSAASDIRVITEGVAPVHCRISWKQGQFEVAATTPDGVDWNGTRVMQAALSPGDVIRIADIELIVQAAEDDSPSPGAVLRDSPPVRKTPTATPETGEAGREDMLLKPITSDELPVHSFGMSQSLTGRVEPAPPSDGPAANPPQPPGEPADLRPGMSRVQGALDLDELARQEVSSTRRSPLEREQPRASGLASTAARLRQRMQTPQRRPGEQDVLHSPLVIGLEVGALLLVLTAATIWFVLTREAAQREFDTAQAQLESGQFAQAIESFEQFLRERGGHRLAEAARLSIATARVEQPISGAVPAWDAGLKALDGFITQYRDSEAFQDPESPARKYVINTAGRIAMGAAETARTTRKRPPLAVSSGAVKLLELYSPPETRPAERLQEIAGVARAAETAIVQQEAFDGVAEQLETALTAETPLVALAAYRRLLDRYPMAQEDKTLKARLRKTLDLIRVQTVRDETRREALRGPKSPEPPPAPLTLTRRSSSRSDVVSAGGTVFVTAEDCVYGVDATTGEPLWRQPIGLDPPFPPVAVAAGVPAVLIYDARHGELVLLQQRTGQPIWRLPLPDRPQGAPLIFEGQILIVTAGGSLEQIDLQSGASTSRLKFPQGLVGPPLVSLSGERLYVPGAAHLLYVLTRRPLACEQAVWLGHGPGAIEAPPLMMRSYLLLAENDRADSARLRMLDTSPENLVPRAIAEHRIDGVVRDSLAVRGKQLVVASASERLSAFTIAETGDQQSLAFVASYQIKNPRPVPIFLTVGSDDQFWATSTALRRFTITRDSLLPAKQELAIGLASQPLQVTGDSLYVGRRLPFSRAVVLSEVDRQRMATVWQTSVGASILADTQPSREGATVCVTSLGDLFQLTASRVQRGGFEMQSLGQVPVPEGVKLSLSASRLADGRLAVSCGGDEPHLWIIGSDGIPRDISLTKPLEAEPIVLGPGILLPLDGRLRLVGRDGMAAIADDLPAPISDARPPVWKTLAPLDETQALAVNDQGRVSRVQFRTSPVAHLAEITHWDAGSPIDQKPGIDRGRVVVADASGRVVLLDAASFEPLGEIRLDQPAGRPPWPVGEQVFIELAAATKLVCCDLQRQLARQWELPLEGAALVGCPIVYRDRLLIALRDGRLLIVDATSGTVTRTLDLEQRLSFGPERWGDLLIVGTLDGSLLALNAWLDQNL
ncbi:MAG: hypothetical protein EXS05_07540 [Planctomycetaceae bacterium]|nr:hypothetical protein [Planctomycetaceae bacterium]